jgi:hypothetical protein
MFLKSGSLYILETAAPVQACNGIALLLPLIFYPAKHKSPHKLHYREQLKFWFSPPPFTEHSSNGRVQNHFIETKSVAGRYLIGVVLICRLANSYKHILV